MRITNACFHPGCFTCVECDKKLVHESFISDDKFNIYCEEDYNRKKACRCSYCKKPIAPKPGEKTVPRLRALGKDFHPDCFKCEVSSALILTNSYTKLFIWLLYIQYIYYICKYVFMYTCLHVHIVLTRIVVCSWTPASKEKNAIPGEIMSFAFDVIGRNLALMKKVMAIRSPVIFTLRWQTIYTWQLVYATDLTEVTHSDFLSHIGNTALQLNVVHMMLILSLSNTIL